MNVNNWYFDVHYILYFYIKSTIYLFDDNVKSKKSQNYPRSLKYIRFLNCDSEHVFASLQICKNEHGKCYFTWWWVSFP